MFGSPGNDVATERLSPAGDPLDWDQPLSPAGPPWDDQGGQLAQGGIPHVELGP